jgi:gliding motility-associated-like protein
MRVSTVFLLVLSLCLGSSAIGQNYTLNGDAVSAGGTCVSVTQNQLWQNGSVWYNDQMDLSQPFSLEFNMTFGIQDANGADGMVFVLQTVGPDAIGSSGAGMGFAGFNPSFGIEFDTYQNSDIGDPFEDHIAFMRDGINNHFSGQNLAGPVSVHPTNINVEDAQPHGIKITWNPATQLVELYFDCLLRLSDNINLVGSVFGGNPLVYWGFTGSTGGLPNLHQVCLAESYSFETDPIMYICAGESVELNANGNPQGAFNWIPSTGVNAPTSQSTIATPAVSTNYCCDYTDVCGNTTSTCIQVEVETPPVIDAGPTDSFCAGDSYTLQSTCDQGTAVLSWTTPDGQFTSVTNILQPTIDSPGTYTVQATSAMAECPSTDDVTIEQIPLPNPVFDADITKCTYDDTLLDIGNAWESVEWFDGTSTSTYLASVAGDYAVTVFENGCDTTVTFTVSNVMLPSIELGPNQLICAGDVATIDAGVVVLWQDTVQAAVREVTETGSYTAVFESDGCVVSDSVSVEVQWPPVIDLGRDTVFCEGEVFELNAAVGGIWQDGSVGASYAAEESGDYYILVQQGPCVVRDTVELTRIDLPRVTLGNDPIYCEGQEFEVGFTATGVDSFVWSTGDTTETVRVSESIDLALVAGNICGSTTDSLHVEFEDCSAFVFLPTSFTPNGDGLNDFYMPSVANVELYELWIFDQWGRALFHTQDPAEVWQGDSNGGGYYIANGIYNFRVLYRTNLGTIQERRGFIQIIR